jgi:hypothetical protein
MARLIATVQECPTLHVTGAFIDPVAPGTEVALCIYGAEFTRCLR